MKYVLILLTLFSQALSVNAQDAGQISKIFIVRHAEKESGKDPVLTADGYKRAGDLRRTLQNDGVQKIYVSQYRRTQLTGDSLRIQLQIDTVHYEADTLCDNLVNTIMQHRDFGKTILIIAHSNTIPKIIRKLGVLDFPQADIPDGEFDHLYLITYKNEKARVKKLKYGAKSGFSGQMN